jgi:hypothetical protein
MTARTAASLSSLGLVLALAGCTNFFEIPIETPIQPKLDVTPFTRVLVAGFITGGSEDVDTNAETVRLLRSQLRTKSGLKIIDADLLPLADMATGERSDKSSANGAGGGDAQNPAPSKIKDEKDLEPYERLFADVSFWKKIGEEYQNPLIVTGTILFTPHTMSGFVTRDQETYDAFGRRRVTPVRVYQERKGFILRPKFVFIDGRTGAELYKETFREEVLYNVNTNTPALSSYFELMDRLIPSFLNTLSSQKIKGSRILLK